MHFAICCQFEHNSKTIRITYVVIRWRTFLFFSLVKFISLLAILSLSDNNPNCSSSYKLYALLLFSNFCSAKKKTATAAWYYIPGGRFSLKNYLRFNKKQPQNTKKRIWRCYYKEIKTFFEKPFAKKYVLLRNLIFNILKPYSMKLWFIHLRG